MVDSLLYIFGWLMFEEGYLLMVLIDKNYVLFEMYSDVSELLGYGLIVFVNLWNVGVVDILFVVNYVEMVIDGLGFMGEGGYIKDEVVDMIIFL